MNWKFALFGVVMAFCLVAFTTADEVNCSNPPKRQSSQICCPIPNLITDEIREKCMKLPGTRTPQRKELQPDEEEKQLNAEDEAAVNDEDEQTTESEEPIEEDTNLRPHPHHHRRHHHRRHHHPRHHHPRHHHPRHHHRHHHHHRRPHPHPQHCGYTNRNADYIACVFNETGIFDKEHQMNETRLHEYLSVTLKETPDMISVVENSFKTCHAKQDSFRTRFARDRSSFRWHPRFARRSYRYRRSQHRGSGFMFCVHKQTFMNCAPSVWTNTQDCNDRRKYIETCTRPMFWEKQGVPNELDTHLEEEEEDENENVNVSEENIDVNTENAIDSFFNFHINDKIDQNVFQATEDNFQEELVL